MKLYTLDKHPRRRCTLVVNIDDVDIFNNFEPRGIVGKQPDYFEELLKGMTNWCAVNECGVRTSWHMFQFKTLKEMNMFVLRWA